jgi:Domain of unknown function (DUF4405)
MFRYCLNILMCLSFLAVLITGLLKFPQLHPATMLRFWHLSWLMVSMIHDWSGLVLGVLILIHLWLNRHWFRNRTKIFFSRKIKTGIDQ